MLINFMKVEGRLKLSRVPTCPLPAMMLPLCDCVTSPAPAPPAVPLDSEAFSVVAAAVVTAAAAELTAASAEVTAPASTLSAVSAGSLTGEGTGASIRVLFSFWFTFLILLLFIIVPPF